MSPCPLPPVPLFSPSHPLLIPSTQQRYTHTPRGRTTRQPARRRETTHSCRCPSALFAPNFAPPLPLHTPPQKTPPNHLPASLQCMDRIQTPPPADSPPFPPPLPPGEQHCGDPKLALPRFSITACTPPAFLSFAQTHTHTQYNTTLTHKATGRAHRRARLAGAEARISLIHKRTHTFSSILACAGWVFAPFSLLARSLARQPLFFWQSWRAAQQRPPPPPPKCIFARTRISHAYVPLLGKQDHCRAVVFLHGVLHGGGVTLRFVGGLRAIRKEGKGRDKGKGRGEEAWVGKSKHDEEEGQG